MKKLFVVFLSAIFGIFSAFAIEKSSKTLDNFLFKLYQIDSSSNSYRYEYYIELKSSETEEYFVWCSTNLSSAMVKFKELENTEVVSESKESSTVALYTLKTLFGKMTLEELEEKKKSATDWEIVRKDKRGDWRKMSFDADVYENECIRYFIDNM